MAWSVDWGTAAAEAVAGEMSIAITTAKKASNLDLITVPLNYGDVAKVFG